MPDRQTLTDPSSAHHAERNPYITTHYKKRKPLARASSGGGPLGGGLGDDTGRAVFGPDGTSSTGTDPTITDGGFFSRRDLKIARGAADRPMPAPRADWKRYFSWLQRGEQEGFTILKKNRT